MNGLGRIRSWLPIAVLAAISAAACSGGGGGGSGSVPVTSATPAGGSGAHTVSSAAFSVTIPAAPVVSASARRAQFISPNTSSVAIVVTSGNATPAPPTVANVTPGSPNCTTTGAGTTCLVSVVAPVGPTTFAVTLYAGPNATGAVLSSASVNATLVDGQINQVPIALSGTVARIDVAIAGGNNTIPGGYATSLPLTVVAKDASGATIVGAAAYAAPIVVTDSDTSGATGIAVGTLSPVASVTLTAPAANLSLVYNGAVIPSTPSGNAVVTASASGVAATNTSPGVFQYINDRFFGHNVPRTLRGTETDTSTDYTGATPSPTVDSYPVVDVFTILPNQTFNGQCCFNDFNDVYTFRDDSTTPSTQQTITSDSYRRPQLTTSGVVELEYGATTSAPGVSSGQSLSSTLWLAGDPFVVDMIPHVNGGHWTNDGARTISVTPINGGTLVQTLVRNRDGSFAIDRTQPNTFTLREHADGSATRTLVTTSPPATHTFTFAVPVVVGGTYVIPVSVSNTPPGGAPTNYQAADWYPGGALAPNPLYFEGATQSVNVPIPTACGVPAAIGTVGSKIGIVNTVVSPARGFTTALSSDEYYISGVGIVCYVQAVTQRFYSLTTGVLQSDFVSVSTEGVQSVADLTSANRSVVGHKRALPGLVSP